MLSLNLVDPELLPLLDAFKPETRSLETLPQWRDQFKQFVSAQLAATAGMPSSVTRSERNVPASGSAPAVQVFVYTPSRKASLHCAYLDMHSGGYIGGTALMKDSQNRLLSETVGAVVVAVEYRLAPETRFPGAIEDCYAALKWLVAQADELGVDRERITIGGDSAGGGLAAGLSLLARDRGEVKISQVLLNAPMLDNRPSSNPSNYAGEFIWRQEDNAFAWSCLLGDNYASEEVSLYAAAARATNLAGLPPTFIGVGALDLFLEQNTEYARRLARAGVPVELHVYPGAFHGFQTVRHAAVSQRYFADLYNAISGSSVTHR